MGDPDVLVERIDLLAIRVLALIHIENRRLIWPAEASELVAKLVKSEVAAAERAVKATA